MYTTNNDKNQSKSSINTNSQVKNKHEIIASLNTESESITAEIEAVLKKIQSSNKK